MIRASIWIVAIVTTACGAPMQSEPAPSFEAATVTVALPEGDAAAGRQAFADLKCTACHAVPSDANLPAPISSTPGPPLDAITAHRDISYLLASIMTPSHAVSLRISDDVRSALEGVLSPMGDFSRAMTVRQLVDVHAYVRSLG